MQILGPHPIPPKSEPLGGFYQAPQVILMPITFEIYWLSVMPKWVCVGSDFADFFLHLAFSDVEVILKDSNMCT